ncbi:MAG TPA: hypothetical protein VN030_06430 [Cellvibrio sp.]|nr:hypothetical protein [Cellvibrio sp.]
MAISRRLSNAILAIATTFSTLTACAMKPADTCPSLDTSSYDIGAIMLNQIKEKLHLAKKDIEEKHFDLSIKNSKSGIDMLGKTYLSCDGIDDTGMKISLAKMEEEKNNLEFSATLYMRVLESRITFFELKR